MRPKRVTVAKNHKDAIRIARAAVVANKAERYIFGLVNNVDVLVKGTWYRLWEDGEIEFNNIVFEDNVGANLIYQ